ncbi:MAG: DMT family transporter [Victivallales bacterium]|nr:DMT family transporter [Victivallales bacterium]
MNTDSRMVLKAYLFMGTAWLIWSFDPILIRLIGDDVARPIMSGGALTIAGFLMIVPALRGYVFLLRRKELWGRFCFYILFGTVIADLLYVIAIRNLNPGLTSLILRSQIIMAIFAAWLCFGERPNRITQLGIAIVLIGYAANAWFSIAKSSAPSRNPTLGWMCAFGAAVLWTSSTILGKKLMENIKSSHLCGMRLLTAGIITIVSYCCMGGAGEFAKLSCTQWGMLAIKAALCSVLTFALYMHGLHLAPVTAAAAMEQAAPLCTLFVATFILKEPVPLQQWFAIAVVFAGAVIILVNQYRKSSGK